MIDYFALALTHFLIALAVIRLLGRGDLDDDGIETPVNGAADAPDTSANGL